MRNDRNKFNNKKGPTKKYDKKESKKYFGKDNKSKKFDNKNSRSRSYKTEKRERPEDQKIRLNKFIANAGICSRREADKYIQAGVVTVNGKVITELGYKVNPWDDVRFGGERIKPEKKVYLLLNKPKGYTTTTKDPHTEKTVMQLIENCCKERVYPVGRLDKDTTGLLLFTNDGELAKKLSHPSSNIEKIYVVTLDKNFRTGDFDKLIEGFTLDDGHISADAASYYDPKEKSQIIIQIHSGRNRIIRRMMEHLGYKVKKLDRIKFAGLTKRGLKRGYWRFLTPKEISFLKML
jgi:23S rRNA pseudouridine2605 synthase